jgi:50S ribosomal subunit-associated GTPase HflX
LEKIQEVFQPRSAFLKISIPNTRMDLVNLFYQQGSVQEIKYLDNEIKIKVNLPKSIIPKLLQNKDIKQID